MSRCDSAEWAPPTACRSAAASALEKRTSKSNDLACEAVGCNGLFGGSLRHFRFAFARESSWLLVKLQQKLLNLPATRVGEPFVLTDNPESTFF